MATTRSQISKGATGSSVKELQEALNKNGYKLDVDGVFGSKTQAAVKDYQSKNNLQVDGIVGKNTWGALFPTTSTATTTTPATTTTKKTTTSKSTTTKKSTTSGSTSTTTTPKTSSGGNTPSQYSAEKALASVPEFSYKAYAESPTVTAAKEALQAQLNNKPAAYQSSYEQQINDVLNKILNREEFSYDLNGDALYQQYKDQYTTQGKQAMMDTMGQAAALTGGYGNSYAQSVGQQTYQGYLQQLNDKVPELYQLALDKYNREGEDLYNQYGLYTDRENTEYGRHRDDVSDYYTGLDLAYNQYLDERNFDYGKYSDDRNLAYQTNRDKFSDAMWATEFGYGQERDSTADQQWLTQFNEALRQYNEELEYQKGRDQVSDAQWQTEYDENLRRWNLANGLNADGTPITTTSKRKSGTPKLSADDSTSQAPVGSSFMDSVIKASENSKLATTYNENKNAQLKAENNGKSYYGEVLQEVSTNDTASSRKYINDLYKNSYINEAEKNSLLQYVDMKEKSKK